MSSVFFRVIGISEDLVQIQTNTHSVLIAQCFFKKETATQQKMVYFVGQTKSVLKK